MVRRKVQQPVVGPWVVRTLVGAVIAILAGGAGAWVHDQNRGASEASTINAVQAEEIETTQKDIGEVKTSLRRIEDKIDDLK